MHVLPRYHGARPASGGETDHLIPAPAHPHLVISNYLEVLRGHLGTAQSFDFSARLSDAELLLIFGWAKPMLRRGGHLRCVLERDVDWVGQGSVEVYRASLLPCDYYRVRKWMEVRGPGWVGRSGTTPCRGGMVSAKCGEPLKGL